MGFEDSSWKCCICGKSTMNHMQKFTRRNTEQGKVNLHEWNRSCILSMCKTLDLSSELEGYFLFGKFCSTCHYMIADAEFIMTAVTRLQARLKQIKAKTTRLLFENYDVYVKDEQPHPKSQQIVTLGTIVEKLGYTESLADLENFDDNEMDEYILPTSTPTSRTASLVARKKRQLRAKSSPAITSPSRSRSGRILVPNTRNSSIIDTDCDSDFIYSNDHDSDSDFIEDEVPTKKRYVCKEKQKLDLHKIKPSTDMRTSNHIAKTIRLNYLRENLISCEECPKKFLTERGKRGHRQLAHGLRRKLPESCKICSKTFEFPEELKWHEGLHSPETPFDCAICRQKHEDYDQLINHVQLYHEFKRFICNYTHCLKNNITLSTRNEMLAHLKSIHPDDGRKYEYQIYQCGLCSVRLSRPSAMLYHNLLVHAGIPPMLSCNFCENKFYTIRKLNAHQQTAHSHDARNKLANDKDASQANLSTTLEETSEDGKELAPDVTTFRQYVKNNDLQNSRQHVEYESQYIPLCCNLSEECKEKVFHRPRHMRAHIDKCHRDMGAQPLFHCNQCHARYRKFESLSLHYAKLHLLQKPTYKCRKCDKGYLSPSAWTRHVVSCKVAYKKAPSKTEDFKSDPVESDNSGNKQKNSEADAEDIDREDGTLVCQDCGKKYSSLRDLYRHQSLDHITILSCTMCSKRFTSKSKLDSHLEVHKSKDGLTCIFCAEQFANSIDLVNHVQIEHDGMRFLCNEPECLKNNVYFRKGTELREHLVEVHQVSDAKLLERLYHCRKCELRFFKKCVLDHHDQLKHMANSIAMCDVCGKEFSASRALKQHMLRVHDGKYKCPVCTKCFEDQNSMKVHEKLHDPDQPFTCVICNSEFVSTIQLHRHVLHNHEERPFNCTFPNCTETFTSKGKAEWHFRLEHRPDKPIPCPLCPWRAKYKSELEMHLVTHRAQGDNRYDCTQEGCGRKFRHRCTRNKHIRMAHGVGKPFVELPCKICGKVFNNISALTNHELYHATDRPFLCDLCPSAFKSSRNLVNHKLVHVKKTGTNIRLQKPRKARLADKRLKNVAPKQPDNISTVNVLLPPTLATYGNYMLEEPEAYR